MEKVILKAADLDGYLTTSDKDSLESLTLLFNRILEIFPKVQLEKKPQDFSQRKNSNEVSRAQKSLITLYNEMGDMLQDICKKNHNIHVYSFVSPQENHSEASRVISKLRDINTENFEFVYYIQRAYEMLFKLAWGSGNTDEQKNHLIVKTPVTHPVQNYAVHKITNIDKKIENTVMCVMLRGALLPSMIMSKEIEEYSSGGYVTPFALFKIYRNESKREIDMEYILDLENSFFNLDDLNDKDLIFADPMNATGGSLVTVVNYLISKGIKPRSIKFLNVISALKGTLRIIRAIENCDVYTIWMDGVLNKDAYIMPGLGDAGDRINGNDSEINRRNIIRLLADYGSGIANLYRSQYREIENTVLKNITAGKR
ncbi:MAG: uracil phosphoribosyltransferase [Treponema sp.]|nr:uracil phosphoribosyltransferase [Treponema sp.]MCL2250304.1 uracil phosphoribosyltransferase [Treponema sp.]